jgi:hypothetical protein
VEWTLKEGGEGDTMPNVQSVISRMEGVIGTTPTSTLAYQSVSTWVSLCKQLLRSESLRDATDWEFTCSDDPDEDANDVETGATLYAVLYEQASVDASPDIFVITDDADGTLAVSAGDTVTVTASTIQFMPPATATDGVPEYHGHIFVNGVSFTNHMCVGADGLDGTNPAAGDLRVWLLYRTTAGLIS